MVGSLYRVGCTGHRPVCPPKAEPPGVRAREDPVLRFSYSELVGALAHPRILPTGE